MRIRYTFYTAADDFSYKQEVEESREWLRTRVVGSEIRPAGGAWQPGSSLDELSPEDIGRWVVAVSMGIVRDKAKEDGGYVSFFTEHWGHWVSIFATQVQAIEAQVVGDEEQSDIDSGGAREFTGFTDEPPLVH